MAGGWAGRGNYLPPDWPKRRAACLKRDGGYCQIRGPRCVLTATEADHIVNVARGGSHDLSNLQATCEPCHQAKTYDERRLPPRTRPPERHPGLL